MTRIATTPRTGTFAGRTVYTDTNGEGIYTRRIDGTHQQHAGTSQTPTFKTQKRFSDWLRKHYSEVKP